MAQFILKIFLSALVIASVSELAKRNTFIAALFAALPFTSMLAILWLYFETKDVNRIAELCQGIFWAVLPSLVFFIILPILIRKGMGFAGSLSIAIASTLVVYLIYYRVLKFFGINF